MRPAVGFLGGKVDCAEKPLLLPDARLLVAFLFVPGTLNLGMPVLFGLDVVSGLPKPDLPLSVPLTAATFLSSSGSATGTSAAMSASVSPAASTSAVSSDFFLFWF